MQVGEISVYKSKKYHKGETRNNSVRKSCKAATSMTTVKMEAYN